MITINFFKRHGEHFLESIQNGKPIEPMGNWDTDKVLSLAGACFYAVAAHGPKEDQFHKSKGIEVSRHSEQLEARIEGFNRELHAAVQFYSELVASVGQGVYDNAFEQEVGAALFVEETGRTRIKPVLGFKKTGGGEVSESGEA